MSTLKEKARQILTEKQTKIIPNNLPNNVTAFGVQGSIPTIPSGSSASYIDMNATTYGDWGDGYRTLECTFNSDTLHKSGSSISVPLTNPNMETNLVENMGITANKIKKDETILGVTGTYEGGTDTSDANAQASDIDNGKTAYVNGTKITGTGTILKGQTKSVTPSTAAQTITPDARYNGLTQVAIGAVDNTIDANIVQANIKAGVTILGVQGNLEPDKPNQTKSVTPTTSQQTIEPDVGYELASVTINAVDNTIDNNIAAENIKDGITILGITGTLEEGIDTSDATATENDIEKNKTAYVDGQLIIGAVEKQYVLNLGRDDFAQLEVDSSNNLNILAEMTDKCILQENASINISVDNDLIIEEAGITADKIVEGESIFGVEGIAQTGGEGYTGYYVGEGSSWNTGDASVSIYDNRKLEFSMTHLYQDNLIIAPEGGVGIDATFSDVATAIGLTPGKIKKDETIIGVTGTYEGSGEQITNITLPSAITFANSDITEIPNWFLTADASMLKSMNYLFDGCNMLQTANLSGRVYPNMGNFQNTFARCSNLTTMNMSNITVNDLSTLNYLCSYDNKLTTANLSGLKLSRATTYFEQCFRGCNNLTSIDMSNITYNKEYDSHSIQANMMFQNCFNLTSFNFGIVSNNSLSLRGTSMFQGCNNLTTVNLYNVDSFYDINCMFMNCRNLTDIIFKPTATVDALRSQNIYKAFNNCPNLSNNTLSNITNLLTRYTNANVVNTFNYMGFTENQCVYISNLSDYKNILWPNGWRTGYSNIDNATEPDRAFIDKYVSLRLSSNIINELSSEGTINDVLLGENRYIILGAQAYEGSAIWDYQYTSIVSDLPTDISSITSTTDIVNSNDPIGYNDLKANNYLQFVRTEFMDDPNMGSGDLISATCTLHYKIDITNSDSTNLIVMLDVGD